MIDNEAQYLNDVAEISAGYPFRGAIREVTGTGVVAIQMKDIKDDAVVSWSSCVETELTGKRVPDYVRSGDVLFNARGNHNYALVIEEVPPKLMAVASPHFYVIRIKSTNILPAFIAWELKQTPCQRHFIRTSEGTLTKSIRRTTLEKTPIAIPSLEKQRAIIELSNTLRNEQKILRQIMNNGEAMMNAIAVDLVANKQ